MKKITKLLPLLLVFAIFVSINDAAAQRKKKSTTDEYFDESGGSFKQKLWYGGGITLGLNNSQFNFGLSPMVGYKFSELVSFGPRAEFLFTSGKFTNGGSTVNYNLLSYGIGPFARLKPLPQLFAHVEYQYLNSPIPESIDSNNKLVSRREGVNNFFIGAGYTSGAGSLFGYELSVLYNVLEPEDSVNIPFVFRGAFTYNF